MPRLCSYVLSNGNRCHCPANRDDEYCRHHNLDGMRHRQPNPARNSGHDPEPNASGDDKFRPHLEWAHLRRFITQSATLDDISGVIETLMSATSEGDMAERTAGRLLVLLYRRREQLMNEVAWQQLQALQNEIAKYPGMEKTLIDAARNDPGRASSQVISFQSAGSIGSKSEIATHQESNT